MALRRIISRTPKPFNFRFSRLTLVIWRAAIGDQMARNDPKYGGWGLGTTKTSIIFLSAILSLVIYLVVTKKDQIILEADQIK